MEPQLPPVGPPIERGPVVNGEQAPAVIAPNLTEAALIQSPEQARNIETSSGDTRGLAMPITQPRPIASPQSPTQIPVTNGPAVATTTNPTAAADDDLIEKEWVAKAKQVIQATKDDPRAQASQVSQLMADYVLKRYGKEVGKAPQ